MTLVHLAIAFRPLTLREDCMCHAQFLMFSHVKPKLIETYTRNALLIFVHIIDIRQIVKPTTHTAVVHTVH